MTSGLPPRFPDDRTNPYAAPEAEIGPGEYAGFGLSPTPFTVGDVMSRTWQIYKGQLWICIGVVIFCFVINIAGQLVLGILDKSVKPNVDLQTYNTIVMVVMIGLMPFQFWIGIGQALFLLRVARGQSASFGDVFRGGAYILPVLVSSLAFGLVLGGVVALGLIPGGVAMAVTGGNPMVGPVIIGLGLLIAMVAGAILALRLSQYYYLIIDRGAGIMESLRLSLEVTRGNAGNIFVIVFSTGLINLAGLLACGVGLLFTIPFTALLFPVTYLALTGQPIADPLAPGKPAFDAGVLGPDGPVSDSF